MKADDYLVVAEKVVDAVLQMEQIIERLLAAQDEYRYWSEQTKQDNDPY